MPDSPAVDRGAVERLRKWGGEALALRMIDIFLRYSPERVIQIRNGIAGEDAGEAETGAHSLKSSAGNVGAVRLQTLCQAVETLAHSEDFVGLKERLKELEEAYQEAREELEDLLEGMKA
ncbi:MAG: Hpt domain-containing protein [Longimicrobiales bacterium]